jgi:hypothetical protein
MITKCTAHLFPSPTKITEKKGFFHKPESLGAHFQQASFTSLIHVSPVDLNMVHRASAELMFLQENLGHDDAYKIECERTEVTISSTTEKGALYALHTLQQIFSFYTGNIIPCFEITDYPVLTRRGFMLDVSRCKVPTMTSMFSLIDLLSRLRFNELQLYIEHTFAFADHGTVWQDASPLTGEEIQEIDQYCRERFIDLVPNLNSFGHFERWLRHEPYKKLAECPEGFQRDEPFMVRDHGSVLKPNQESLDFIDSLYAEYLPNFSSTKFNVGLDEPWELGQGWSKAQVDSKGKDVVYIDHLKGILHTVEKRGKSMEFWADVLFEKPENAQFLPLNASPIIWGYEADHPFEDQANTISKCGLNYSLAPGTANWRSFSGRWQTARKNIKSACQNASKYSAEGILLTTWGDCGNHQPWATMYPPLFLASQLAWNGEDKTDEAISSVLDRDAFHSPSCGLGQAFIELGKLDQTLGFKLPNNSLPWFSLFTAQPDKIVDHILEQTSVSELKEGLALLEFISSKTYQPTNNFSAKMATQELQIGLDMSKWGVLYALSLIDKKSDYSQHFIDNKELVERFKKVWLLRARNGGLEEAVQLLEKALQQTKLRQAYPS